jgi:sec-independent protein translocase protein TatA
MPGPTELLLILIIVLVVFGAKRIPEIMSGVGKGIKDFKRAVDSDEPQSTTTRASSTPPPDNKTQAQ